MKTNFKEAFCTKNKFIKMTSQFAANSNQIKIFFISHRKKTASNQVARTEIIKAASGTQPSTG